MAAWMAFRGRPSPPAVFSLLDNADNTVLNSNRSPTDCYTLI